MKRTISILLSFAFLLSLVSCNPSQDQDNTQSTLPNTTGEIYELALITDVGTIDDKSFNQGSWEGMEKYAKEHQLSYKYYVPMDKSHDAYMDSIDLAISSGAKVIVTPGFYFETAIYEAQASNPDITFILLDGEPKNKENAQEIKVADNTVAVLYAEEEAGFLAGYAAVKDGHKKVGFMGGGAVPPVIRFGIGYAQGVNYAAKELGLTDVELMYTYTNEFNPSPDVSTKANAWYNAGTEVIFACAGGAGSSVMSSADQNEKLTIGVDIDQASDSKSVITSAVKELGVSVYDCLDKFYKNEFPGGQTIIYDATINGVGLPMETSRFATFSQEDYDVIYKKIHDKEIEITDDISVPVNEMGLDAIKINYSK